jgi:hypothetical protein
MKRNFLLAAALIFGLSCHSLFASANVLQNPSFESGTTDWNFPTDGSAVIDTTSGQQTSGTASALLDPLDTGNYPGGEIFQTFPTVPGTSYIVEFDFETLDSALNGSPQLDVYVSGTNGQTLNSDNNGNSWYPATKFVTAIDLFTATGTSTTIDFQGEDEVVVDNVIVESGSFSVPGTYTGKVVVSSTIPSAQIASFHTESVAAKITSSGGLSWIQQPGWVADDSDVENVVNSAAIISNASLAIINTNVSVSGTAVPVTIKSKTHLKFVLTYPDSINGAPVMDTLTFTLKKKGK